MRFAPYFLGLSLVLVSYACGSSSTTPVTIVRPELVGVSPEDFLGAVPCEDEPDAAQDGAHSYVATLFDVTPDATTGKMPSPGLQLPSSPPTSCFKPVTFSFVVANHRYLAEVDAYDVAPTHLTPLATGSRLQVDGSGARVAPRWKATCGGYPASPAPDAGLDSGIQGAAGADDGLPGVFSYSTLTQTPHDCRAGLQPVTSTSN